jgi:hypothetical protein
VEAWLREQVPGKDREGGELGSSGDIPVLDKAGCGGEEDAAGGGEGARAGQQRAGGAERGPRVGHGAFEVHAADGLGDATYRACYATGGEVEELDGVAVKGDGDEGTSKMSDAARRGVGRGLEA